MTKRPFDRRRWDSHETREEIRFHLDMRTRELEAQGHSPEEAARLALASFGDPDRIADDVMEIDAGRPTWSTLREISRTVAHDVRYAFRFLRGNPVFSAVIIGTLALGIGANTAIFSLLDRALLRSPAVRDAASLVGVYTTSRRGFPRASSSYPDFEDYRDRSTAIQDMAAMTTLPASLGDDEQGALPITVQAVTGNTFELLGVAAELGRLIQPSDDRRGEGTPVVVLSHALWQSQWGGDPGVVGSQVRLNGSPLQVIGIVDADYQGLQLGTSLDAWVPMQSAGPLASGFALESDSIFDQRNARWIGRLVGRLAPGATPERAREELLAISEELRLEDPVARGPRSVTVDALAHYLLPLGDETALRQFIWLLVGVVGSTLLLACANLANLLLARASTRRSEIGVRLALGAARGRLVRQLLTESLILALLGGLAGLALATVLLRTLAAYELPGGVPIGALGVGLDGRVLLAALGLAVGTTVLFGLLPALQATRSGLVDALRTSRAPEGRRRTVPIRDGLLALQVALCLLLLVGSGLFIRTLQNALSADVGVQADGVALARFSLSSAGYGASDAQQFVQTLRERIAALPGTESAAVSTLVPFQGGGFMGTFITVDGYAPAPDEEMRVDLVFVTPGYLRTLGIELLEGRDIRDDDVEGSGDVVLVSRAMAERYWPEGQAVGGVVRVGDASATVVGVPDDVRWSSLGGEITNFMYIPFSQSSRASRSLLTVTARTTGDPELLLNPIRQEIGRLDTDVSPRLLATMDQLVGQLLMPQRLGALLLSAFGVLALVLAAIGIVGVVSYRVRSRRRTIGIRMALGARRGQVLWQVAADAARPLIFGLALGLVAALLLQDTVADFLFEVPANDPLTYVGVAALLTVVAFAATVVPAREAVRVDPVQVLKSE